MSTETSDPRIIDLPSTSINIRRSVIKQANKSTEAHHRAVEYVDWSGTVIRHMQGSLKLHRSRSNTFSVAVRDESLRSRLVVLQTTFCLMMHLIPTTEVVRRLSRVFPSVIDQRLVFSASPSSRSLVSREASPGLVVGELMMPIVHAWGRSEEGSFEVLQLIGSPLSLFYQ